MIAKKDMRFCTENIVYSTGQSDFYLIKNDLYKIFLGQVEPEVFDQILFNKLLRTKVSSNIILPKEVLFDEEYKFYGYIENYVNGDTLLNAVDHKNLDLEKRINIVNSLFKALKEVHNYLIVGDIKLDNLMYSDDDDLGYMIDFDYAIVNNSNNYALALYNIMDDLNSDLFNLHSTKQNDIIKLYISSISLLLSKNFEYGFYYNSNFSRLQKIVDKNFLQTGILRDYFEYLKSCVEKRCAITDYLELPVTTSIIKEINSTLKRIKYY